MYPKIKNLPARGFLTGVTMLWIALGTTSRAADRTITDWFVWPSVEPASGSALDGSSLNLDGTHGLPRVSMRNGHFVTPEGQRIRFWGANVAGAEAFPATADQADLIARLLAKGGVNLVRLHHLDNPWGAQTGSSIWPKDQPTHRELEPIQLDKLHRLIASFRDHGIYSNLNLKVAKSLIPEDGFALSVTQLAIFQKRADIFDRRMIDLQKDYARRLLTVKNPYTGFSPAEDPAVAIVEINNENSLLGFWTKDLGRGLDRLPEPFREELRGLWNKWLARRYASDADLRAAWISPAPDSTPSLLPPDASWQLQVNPGSAGTLQPGTNSTAATIQVSAADGIDWHVQAFLRNLSIEDGSIYTVEFLAKADRSRPLGVGIGLDKSARPDDAWRSYGMLETIDLTNEWRTVRLVFPSHSASGAPGALSFNAAQAIGTIEIKRLSIRRGCSGAGLQRGQSALSGNVPLPTASGEAQWADWIRFLADTERAFAEELRTYLKVELHVQALVICSQIDYGGLTGMNREQAMDFADAHAYWQHPDIPGGAWDSPNWTISNSPQLNSFTAHAFGSLGDLALVRVAGKPFSVSEYDHPAPSEFVCEMYPELASFACRQDWDAVYPFVIGAYGTENPQGKIGDFFDQLHHPAKWGFSPFATRVFRRELIPSATESAQLKLGSPLWSEQLHAESLWRQLSPGGKIDFLNHRYAVRDQPGNSEIKATVENSLAPPPENPPVRLVTTSHGKIYIIDAPQAAAAVGYIGGTNVDAGSLHVTCPEFGLNFASVTAVSLDDRVLLKSRHILVTLAARASNQGLVWNDAHTSVGKNWGHGPTIAERVPAVIMLDGAAGGTVYALAPDGSRAKKVSSSGVGAALTFTVQPGDNTLHYEIVFL